MGREVVEFASLKVEGVRSETDLDFGVTVLFLPKKAEQFTEMKRGDIADDGRVVGEFSDFACITDGVLEISGGIDQFKIESLLA